jgi:hypothetical protein
MSALKEIEATIVGADVPARHPELHHYTGKAGFEGIVSSNELWATHYADLNDTTEIIYLRDRLEHELAERYKMILRSRRRASARLDRAIAETGGLVRSAESVAADLVNSFYKSAFNPEDDAEISATASTPFIASLCTHTDEPYERENGLLSQWRGYGRTSGFCLVFDTLALAQMLGREFDAAAYSHLNLSSTHYPADNIKIAELYPELFATCDEFLYSVLKNRPELGDGIEQFFAAATLLKHPAFHEEREVRIVGMPMTERMIAIVRAEHPDATLGARKTVYPTAMAPEQRRFIKLFEGGQEPLPIKRVIVGPSTSQTEMMEWARSICGPAIDVVASRTPFRG